MAQTAPYSRVKHHNNMRYQKGKRTQSKKVEPFTYTPYISKSDSNFLSHEAFIKKLLLEPLVLKSSVAPKISKGWNLLHLEPEPESRCVLM